MTMRSVAPNSEAAQDPLSPHTEPFVERRRSEFSSDAADPGVSVGTQLATVQNRPPRAAVWVGKFRDADLAAVRIASRSAKSPVGRLCAVNITKLGNGWLYPILAGLIFTRWGSWGYHIVALAAINAALMHSLYPLIKRRVQRMRPFEVDRRLPSLLATLDEHSFPSGHTMTLTGVFVPIVLLWPAATIMAIVMACCLAWSRVATAHHYPSDVLAGFLLGAGVSYPISACLISFW
jgi:undecaprenyl-diphosphatase